MAEGRKYLQKHLEKEQPKLPIPESLAEPLAKDLSFNRYGGQITLEKGGTTLTMRYGQENTAEVRHTMNKHADSPECQDAIALYSDWRILDSLVVADTNGKEILNLGPILQSRGVERTDAFMGKITNLERPITVAFPATNDKPNVSEDTYAEAKTQGRSPGFIENSVLLCTNLTAPATLLILLHEVAHISQPSVDVSKLFLMERYIHYLRTGDSEALTDEEKADPELEEKVWQLIIQEERSAWASALNQIRPLVRSGFFDRADVVNYVRGHVLQSYSQVFRAMSSPELKQRIQDSVLESVNAVLDD